MEDEQQGVRRPINEGLEKGGANKAPTNARPPGVPGPTSPVQPVNSTSADRTSSDK